MIDNEQARLASLAEYRLLDTEPEDAYDDIVRLAAFICGTPIAAVSLIDAHRQWFKSILGLDVKETPRSLALCAETIQHQGLTIIPDTRAETRLAANPFVAGESNVRFYAGAPLITEDGYALGSLCVMDRVPRHLTGEQKTALSTLARQVVGKMELSRRAAAQERLTEERQQAEAARRRAEAHATRILESTTDIFFALDYQWRYTYVNARAEQISHTSREQILGRSIWDVFPKALGTRTEREYRRAMEERTAVEFTDFLEEFGVWLEMRAYPTEDGLIIYGRDITERIKQEEILRLEREALRQSETRLRLALESARLGSYEFEQATSQYLEVSDTYKAQFGLMPGDTLALESVMEIIHPDDRARVLNSAEQAIEEHRVFESEYRAVWPDGSIHWLKSHGQSIYDEAGLAVRMIGVCQDITERVLAEERVRVLFEQSSHPHLLLDDDGIIIDCNTATLSLLGCTDKNQIQGIHPACLSPEFQPDGRRSEEKSLEMDALARENGFHRFEWTHRKIDGDEFPVEVTLTYSTVASRPVLLVVWHDLTERRALERERERLLREAQARNKREVLINRINEAIRATTDPEQIQETAACLVGKALGVDRCSFSMYTLQRDTVRVSRDWHGPHLPSFAGEYLLSGCENYVDEFYKDGTAVITDALSPEVSPIIRQVLSSFGIRAFLAVPLYDNGRFVAALTASMISGPRDWTPEEIVLMEAVLTQTQTALEIARVTQREHRIAAQLQEALQPKLPEIVPGLALSLYYKPALAQSEGVGGDFYDVFPVEIGCTALVVGDLSGKGLAAASQVSTVRSMLRAFLHSLPTVAEAVTELNRVLAEHDLLTGFTTLFVGVYDSATGLVNYANCGQEAALLRRAATNETERLVPTGPILGAFEGAQYEVSSVALHSGDTLAIFTDGLTEVGASRTDLLGIDGVAALLEQRTAFTSLLAADGIAEATAQHLIAGVNEFAQSGARDDMCLLVGIVR